MNDFGPLTKLPNNVGNLSKTIVATGFEWLPKVKKWPNLVTLCESGLPTKCRFILIMLTENTRLFRKGKYHCMSDLLFDWFRFSCLVE